MTDTVTPSAAPTEVTPPPAPTVKQLTIADITARIVQELKDPEGYDLADDQVARIEQFTRCQIGEELWEVGKSVPRSDALHILAMYRGDDNERIADHGQGDIRVYTVPLTVVAPGAREYRRITINPLIARMLTDKMSYDAFIEAVAFEEYSVAFRTGVDSDEEPEAKS